MIAIWSLLYGMHYVQCEKFGLLYCFLSEQFPLFFVTEGKIIKNIYYLLIN